MKKLVIIWALAIAPVSAFLQGQDWRGIKALHSTRADVERLIGPPSQPEGSLYETNAEKVSILYSGGNCGKERKALWNVPHETVIGIVVYPKLRQPLSELQIDSSKYRRIPDPHLSDIVQYVNNDDGIQIEVSAVAGKPEMVTSITYGPAAKDSHLRCPGAPERSGEKIVGSHPLKFDEYSNISFTDEKPRLDNFAIYLRKDQPSFKGYIIVYAGPTTRSGWPQARAKRAKDYLVKVRGIETARIVTIDGGCREQLEVELYALPAAMSPPKPNPYR